MTASCHAPANQFPAATVANRCEAALRTAKVAPGWVRTFDFDDWAFSKRRNRSFTMPDL
jgi:hypothetical protein